MTKSVWERMRINEHTAVWGGEATQGQMREHLGRALRVERERPKKEGM